MVETGRLCVCAASCSHTHTHTLTHTDTHTHTNTHTHTRRHMHRWDFKLLILSQNFHSARRRTDNCRQCWVLQVTGSPVRFPGFAFTQLGCDSRICFAQLGCLLGTLCWLLRVKIPRCLKSEKAIRVVWTDIKMPCTSIVTRFLLPALLLSSSCCCRCNKLATVATAAAGCLLFHFLAQPVAASEDFTCSR